MRKSDVMTEENIEKAYTIIAKIVVNYGDKYLPVFQRMHEIKEAYQSKQNLKNLALQVVQKSLG